MALFTTENTSNIPQPTEQELRQKRVEKNRMQLEQVRKSADSPYRTATIKQILETYPELKS